MAATRKPTIDEVVVMLDDVNMFLDQFTEDHKKLNKLHDDEFKAKCYATAIQMAKDFFRNEKHNADIRLNAIKNLLQKATTAATLAAPIHDQTEYANDLRALLGVTGEGVQALSNAYDSFCETLQHKIKDENLWCPQPKLTVEISTIEKNRGKENEKRQEKTSEQKSSTKKIITPAVSHTLLAPPSPPRLTTTPTFVPNTFRLARSDA